jgi:drug/metabolite transporter (DMT)-like permease
MTWTGRGLALVAAFFWGAGYVWTKTVMTWLPPLAAAGARYGLAAVLMLLIASWHGNPLRPLAGYWRRYLLLGFVGITCFQVFLFSGLRFTSAVSAATIMALAPALTALGAAAFAGEPLTPRAITGIVISFCGAALAVLGDNPRGLAGLTLDWGEPLVFIGALCMAFYTVASRRLMPKDVSALSNTTVVVVIGAVFLLPLAIAAFPSTPPGSAAPVAALAAVVLGSTVIAYLCWNRAIETIGVAQPNMIYNFIPVVTMVIASLEGEWPWPEQLAGAAIVIGGITWGMPANSAPRGGSAPDAPAAR